jgi:hypothetical protein
VVVDPNTGKVVATIKNGTRLDALGLGSGEVVSKCDWRFRGKALSAAKAALRDRVLVRHRPTFL